MVDKAISFDGDDYAVIPYHADFDMGSGDFAYELWFYLNSNAGTIIGSNDASSYAPIWLYLGGDGYLYSYFANSTPKWVYNAHAVSTGAWIHYVLTRISGVAKCYFNGVPDASFTGDTNCTIYAPLTDLYLARAGVYSSPLYGIIDIDEFRVYKGQGLDQAAVDLRYAAGAGWYGTLPDSGLIPGYHFDDVADDYCDSHNATVVFGATYVAGKVIQPGGGWGHKFMGISDPAKVYGSNYSKVFGL